MEEDPKNDEIQNYLNKLCGDSDEEIEIMIYVILIRYS